MIYKYITAIVLLFGCSNIFCQKNIHKSNFDIGSIATDSMALVEFNLSTRGDLWKKKWDFDEPISTWFGVELNENGRVFCIDLDGDSNCNATKFGGNHLHGNLTDWQLPFLEHLFLSSNKLDGEIPDFLGTPYLRTLQMSGNKLEGQIPNFKNLRNLVKLDLEYNKLSGVIPEFKNLPDLAILYLGHNNLKGSIPEFSNTSSLKQIYIDHNQLNFCPERFGDLIELTQLILCNNELKGNLPTFLDNLNLKLLDISHNELSGCYFSEHYAHIASLNIKDNRLDICEEIEIFIPNGISPNGDGRNDLFEVLITTSKKTFNRMELIVFDKTSKMVYRHMDYKNDWDGTYMGTGNQLKEGIYFYQLKITKNDIRSGWLSLKY